MLPAAVCCWRAALRCISSRRLRQAMARTGPRPVLGLSWDSCRARQPRPSSRPSRGAAGRLAEESRTQFRAHLAVAMGCQDSAVAERISELLVGGTGGDAEYQQRLYGDGFVLADEMPGSPCPGPPPCSADARTASSDMPTSGARCRCIPTAPTRSSTTPGTTSPSNSRPFCAPWRPIGLIGANQLSADRSCTSPAHPAPQRSFPTNFLGPSPVRGLRKGAGLDACRIHGSDRVEAAAGIEFKLARKGNELWLSVAAPNALLLRCVAEATKTSGAARALASERSRAARRRRR